MRRPLAALLLVIQLQPLWGAVLCLSMLAPPARGEEHCASMTRAVPVQGAPRVEVSATGTGVHQCPLGEACVPTVTALPLLTGSVGRVSARPLPSFRSAEALPGLARFAPPTPPPNL